MKHWIGGKRLTGLLVAATLSALLFNVPARAGAHRDGQLAKQAKITMEAARAIALKAYPGKIVSAELEREAGGSGLRYSFDVKRGGETHELGVDAKTGRLLENSREGANPD